MGKPLSYQQLDWLRSVFPHMANQEIANILGRSVHSIEYYGHHCKLRKTFDLIKRQRRKGAFITNEKRKLKKLNGSKKKSKH